MASLPHGRRPSMRPGPLGTHRNEQTRRGLAAGVATLPCGASRSSGRPLARRVSPPLGGALPREEAAREVVDFTVPMGHQPLGHRGAPVPREARHHDGPLLPPRAPVRDPPTLIPTCTPPLTPIPILTQAPSRFGPRPFPPPTDTLGRLNPRTRSQPPSDPDIHPLTLIASRPHPDPDPHLMPTLIRTPIPTPTLSHRPVPICSRMSRRAAAGGRGGGGVSNGWK